MIFPFLQSPLELDPNGYRWQSSFHWITSPCEPIHFPKTKELILSFKDSHIEQILYFRISLQWGWRKYFLPEMYYQIALKKSNVNFKKFNYMSLDMQNLSLMHMQTAKG